MPLSWFRLNLVLNMSLVPKNNNKKGLSPQQQQQMAMFFNFLNNAANRQKSNRRKRSSKKRSAAQMQLSECASKYFVAIVRPWSPLARGACIPKWPAPPSHKFTIFNRFTVYTGTSGYGFFMYTPTLSNNINWGWYTQNNFAGTSSAVTTTGSGTTSTVGVTAVNTSNSPYATNQLVTSTDWAQGSARGRIVASAASIRYIGTELNRSGRVYALNSSSHSNLGFLGVNDLNAFQDTKVWDVSKKKRWLMDGPCIEDETDYATGSQEGGTATFYNQIYQTLPWCNGSVLSSTDATNSWTNPSMPNLFLISSIADQAFEVEVVVHCEAIGQLASPRMTPSHADPIGFQAIESARQSVASNNVAEVSPNGFLQEVGNTLKEMTGTAATAFGQAIAGQVIATLHPSMRGALAVAA